MNTLLNEDDLKAWIGFEQRGKLEHWLRQNKVCYTYGKGNKLITTQAAINKALAGIDAANKAEDGFF